MTLSIPIQTVRIDPEVVERLLDAELMRDTYQAHTLVQGAKIIGCSPDTFAKALKYHGIEIRVKGTPPPGNGHRLTRQDVMKATYRAYLRFPDRCPPSCPGRATCLDGECTLRELAE